MLEKGVKQRALAKSVGCSHYNVSRWCSEGVHQIKQSNLDAIARALKTPIEEITQRTVEYPTVPGAAKVELTPAEKECLEHYRKLSPLNQAKVLIQISEMSNTN